jgi:hypothetical protein
VQAELLEIDGQQRQLLAEVVVERARHPAPLLLLRGEQVANELT